MTAMVFLIDPADVRSVRADSVDSGNSVDFVLNVSGAEGHHGAAVRRVRPGEPVELVDGQGCRCSGVIEAVAKRDFTVRVHTIVEESDPTPRLIVVQALAKGDRSLAAVEMLTEVGVDVIVPWQAMHSVTKWAGDKRDKGRERWRAVARAATKQSRRARVPVIADVATMTDVSDLITQVDLALLLDENGKQPLAGVEVPQAGSVLLIIGPEGGLDASERAAFVAAGARPVRLGPSILRTSTAGVSAASVVLAATPRWA